MPSSLIYNFLSLLHINIYRDASTPYTSRARLHNASIIFIQFLPFIYWLLYLYIVFVCVCVCNVINLLYSLYYWSIIIWIRGTDKNVAIHARKCMYDVGRRPHGVRRFTCNCRCAFLQCGNGSPSSQTWTRSCLIVVDSLPLSPDLTCARMI